MSKVDELDTYLNLHLGRSSKSTSTTQVKEFITPANYPFNSIDLQSEGHMRFQQLLMKLHNLKRIRKKLTEEMLDFDCELDGNSLSSEDPCDVLLFGDTSADEDYDTSFDDDNLDFYTSRRKLKASVNSLLQEVSLLCGIQPSPEVGDKLSSAPSTPPKASFPEGNPFSSPEPSTPKFDPLFS